MSTRPDYQQVHFNGPVLIVLFIARLALVFTIRAAVNKLSADDGHGAVHAVLGAEWASRCPAYS